MKNCKFLIWFFIFLQSCDPVGFFEYKIYNGSKDKITVDIKSWTQNGDSSVTLQIQPGDTLKFKQISQIVSLSEKLIDGYENYDTIIHGTSLDVKVGKLLLKKNLLIRKE